MLSAFACELKLAAGQSRKGADTIAACAPPKPDYSLRGADTPESPENLAYYANLFTAMNVYIIATKEEP